MRSAAPTGLAPPAGRVVLLGASNATISLPVIVELLRLAVAGPVDLHAAIGLGRSFGMRTCVLGRELDGIVSSGLWRGVQDAAAELPLDTRAIVVDVGNDIAYGVSPRVIREWLADTLGRLATRAQHIAVVGLPLLSLEGLGSLRFALTRRLLFPSSGGAAGRAQREAVLRAARRVDIDLRELASGVGAAWVAPESSWMGLDPIHIRRRCRGVAWARIVGAIHPERTLVAPAVARALRRRLRRARPERWARFSRRHTRAQPCVILDDGSRISLY